MKRIKSNKIKVIIWVSFLILLASGYFSVYYYRDLIFGPPVLFLQDENIEINLYPNGFQSAFVVTNDDANQLTNPQKIRNVVNILDRYDVKGVFFIIPYYKGRYKLTKDDEVTKVLKEITKEGHEVAQHGLTHSLPRKKIKIVNPAKEFVDLPYGEQKRRIFIGKKILEDAGFQINGFRSPAFSANYSTIKILDNYGFLYGSNVAIYPPPLFMANKRYAESVYYPFHPRDLNLIEFVCNGDYFRGHFSQKNFLFLRHRVEKIYKHKGVLILISHIEPINSEQGLKLLDKCLKYITSKNIWTPNLTELALWWKAREVLYAESKIDNDTLKIFLEKGNELNLDDLTINFKKSVKADYYKVLNGDGDFIREGKISDGFVTISH